MSEKLTLVIPNEEDFKPVSIPFAVVTGDGVPDYDNMKSKGKRGGMEYSASIILDKKMAKALQNEILDFWKDNKPKEGGKKPANFKNIVREGKDDYKGDFIVYAKTQTEFNGVGNIVPIVNHEGTKLDTAEFGLIGGKSKGRLAVTLSVYGDDEDAGCSLFLSAVKLTHFEKLEAKGGASAFGGGDEGDVEGAGGFKGEGKKDKSEKKDKKKKKKNK